MDNTGFRKLMEEARQATAAKALEKKKPAAAEVKPADTGPKKKVASKGSERYRRLIEQRARQKDKEIEINRYRDRADERRKEINPDYKNDVQKLLEVDIEKSKYLGGDVEHTHLVKGLDFALLNKVRDELKDKPDDKKSKSSASSTAQKFKIRSSTAKAPKGFKKGAALSGAQLLPTSGGTSFKSSGSNRWSQLKTRTHMGKALLYGMIRGDLAINMAQTGDAKPQWKPNAAAHEAMERMAFEFNLAPDDVILRGDCEEGNELPTTISRSKLDMKDEDEHVLAMLDDQILAKFQLVMVSRGHAKRKQRKRKTGAPAVDGNKRGTGVASEAEVSNAASRRDGSRPIEGRGMVSSSDNTSIFGDVGTYVPIGADDGGGGSLSECPPTPPRTSTSNSYFKGLRAAPKKEEPETDETEAGVPDVRQIVKSVCRLASAADQIELRKHGRDRDDDGHAMNGAGKNYGETHDFDFAGHYDDREKNSGHTVKKQKTRD